jgi:transposase-like protein
MNATWSVDRCINPPLWSAGVSGCDKDATMTTADLHLPHDPSYLALVSLFHPHGLTCPDGHSLPCDQAPHRRRRTDLPDYRCRQCGAVFNLFTGTPWWKTRYSCATVLHIIQGIAHGVSTTYLAEKLTINRAHLAARRPIIIEQLSMSSRWAVMGSSAE